MVDRIIPFQLLPLQGVGEGSTPFPGLLHFTLDPNVIMLSVKQSGIKYHFLSFFYGSTWDWTLYSLGQWQLCRFLPNNKISNDTWLMDFSFEPRMSFSVYKFGLRSNFRRLPQNTWSPVSAVKRLSNYQILRLTQRRASNLCTANKV